MTPHLKTLLIIGDTHTRAMLPRLRIVRKEERNKRNYQGVQRYTRISISKNISLQLFSGIKNSRHKVASNINITTKLDNLVKVLTKYKSRT